MELVEDHWLWYVVWISNTCDPLTNHVLQVICSSDGITRLLIPTTHSHTFAAHSATYPEVVVEKWWQMVKEWEAGTSKKNPYEEPNNGVCTIFYYR